jgi:hypothetical protein
MPALTFRFNTECQVKIEGDSYEEAYLKFKDFMHGEAPLSACHRLEVCPPEAPMIFFEVDDQTEYNTIERFKGDFVQDIVHNSPEDLRTRLRHLG